MSETIEMKITVNFDGLRLNLGEASSRLKELLDRLFDDRDIDYHEEDIKQAFDEVNYYTAALYCLSCPEMEDFSDLTDRLDELVSYAEEECANE